MDTTKALNVRSYGSGRRTIVLAHGFGLDQSIWERYIPMLWRYRVVVFDLAGSGTSARDYFDATRHAHLEGHADDLLRIISQRAIANCAFVGHSVSGMIGILAAIRSPSLFERLILAGCSPRYLDDAGYRGGFDSTEVEGVLAALQSNFREWAMAITPLTVSRPLEDQACQTFLHSLLRMEPDKALVMMKAILMSDYRTVLGECAVPVSLLQTKNDPAVPLEAALYLKDHLPRAELEILDASGHQPQLSAPEVFAAALQRHLPEPDLR